MKKSFFIFSSLFALTALTSCGGDSAIRVAMDLRFPPFETVNSENVPEGVSVDIAKAFGEFIGRPAEIVNTNFAGIIPAIQSQEVDIAIASMSITPARQEVVDFTNPYFYFKIITLVNLDFATTHNLNEDTTVAEMLALTETLKQRDNYDVKFAGIIGQVSASIPQSYGKVVVEYDNLGLAIENVATGQADLLLMSPFPVVSGYRGNPTTTMVIWSPWVSSPIGMAVAKGNTALLEQANAFIDTFTDEGGLYDVLRAKWDDTFTEGLGRFGLDFYINAD